MIDRLPSVANNIKNKLSDHSSAIKEIEQRLNLLQEQKGKNIDFFVHFLLKTACEFNLLKEMHDLLELALFKDINHPLKFEKRKFITDGDNGKTLLGLAAFHGHHEIVSYLVEVRMANINAKDMRGDTPLHQVVYGDGDSSYGTAHDKVAKYLLTHGGDLSVKNDKNHTPYDDAKWCTPLKVENMVGRRFITNTGSLGYYADKVRPIFEKKLAQLKRDQHLPVIRFGGERQPINFKQFCLNHAVEEYVKNKKAAFGYSSIEELYKALDTLSEDEWEHMRLIISSQEPSPYSFELAPIWNQLPSIGKKTAITGIATTLAIYYETQSIFLSVTTGLLSATLAWMYLKEKACKQKNNERSGRYERVNELNQHDRFFKSRNIQQQQQLRDIQLELDGIPTNTNENPEYKLNYR